MGSVKINELKKTFNDSTVFDKLNLEIPDGSFTVILGPSGCGKSTLLRMIAGLEDVTNGSIRIGEQEVTNLPGKDRDIAMVFQNYALYPHMTAYKNVEYGLKIKGVKRKERKDRSMQALATVSLEEQAKKLPSQLSGGQQQRVALARAIVKEPQVFLMDEPLSNLDAKLRDKMRETISNLYKRLNTTFLFVTHDQNEAMSLADNIILLNEGKIMQQGSPKDLYTNPKNRFVAEFIGSPAMNIIELAEFNIGFRPEDILTTSNEREMVSISVETNYQEPKSSEMIYSLHSDFGTLFYTTVNTWNTEHTIDRIYIPIEKLYLFEKEGHGEQISRLDERVDNMQLILEKEGLIYG